MSKIPNYLKGYEELWSIDPHKANLEWFKHAKMGLMIHYGVSTILEASEWVLWHKRIPIAEYEELIHKFDPKNFDVELITDLALEAGMTYINFVTCHHDGFALWNSSKEKFNAYVATGRDIVMELAEACDRKGLGFFAYFTYVLNWRHPYALPTDILDWARPHYEVEEPGYKFETMDDYTYFMDDMHELLEEVLDSTYPLAGVWLDIIMAYYKNPDIVPVKRTYELIRRKNPAALISFKQGATGDEDFASPEYLGESLGQRLRDEGDMEAAIRADKAWDRNKHKHNEVCLPLQNLGWGYNKDSIHDNAKRVRGMLAYANHKVNSNLLVNIGPLPDGSIHEEDIKTLKELGASIKEQGWPTIDEAIPPTPMKVNECGFTPAGA